MHETLDLPDTNMYGIEFSDSLTEDDYNGLVSTLKHALERHTTTRLLFLMNDVSSWEPEELWEDLAFDIRHVEGLDKVAVVGDDLWETWLDKVELIFPVSRFETFGADEYDEAVEWMRGEMEVPGLGPGSVADPEAGAQDEDE